MLINNKYQWRRDNPDSRDHLYKGMAPRLPSLVDMRPFATPVEDQGNIGSCVGHAVAEAIELINKKNSKLTEISRLFVYYQSRVYLNSVGIDSGAYIRDGIKSVYTYGAPLENLWPYVESKFTVRPSDAAYADAAKRKVTGYQRCIDFNSVKVALSNKFPVIVGFDVYSSFENSSVARTGVMTYPNLKREGYIGGHAVLLVGYNDNFRGTRKGYFIAKNSWGSSWGDKGYFYMPYQVIQNTSMSDDFWLISSVNNP